MTEIPGHLIEAYWSAEYPSRRIAAVLAALRPEDAEHVPTWARDVEITGMAISRMMRERDEARAEVERLRNHLEIARGAIGDGGRSD